MRENEHRLRERGATLIEVLVSVAIISILAIITIPLYREALDKAREGTTEASISYLAKALLLYQSDQSLFPTTDKIEEVKKALEKGGYLRVVPIRDAFGRPLRYFSFDGVNYYIFSDGIDGKPNTIDDIVFSNGIFLQDGLYKNQ